MPDRGCADAVIVTRKIAAAAIAPNTPTFFNGFHLLSWLC
jgi:hypothetical protein